jgi:HK97 family phage major capsid protein
VSLSEPRVYLDTIPELQAILRRGLLAKVRIFSGWCESERNRDRLVQVLKVGARPLALARELRGTVEMYAGAPEKNRHAMRNVTPPRFCIWLDIGLGSVLPAGCTGESLVVPKSTGFVTTNLIAEGASITESGPTLATANLGAFKYASFFQISQELANDTPTNLLAFLARQAALSLGLGPAGYGDDLINGTGSSQPRGLLLDAGTGVTGPAGTGTSLGTQGTANQGTDALWNLIGSVAEPYAAAPSATFLMRNASDIIVRKLRDSTGQPVQGLGERGRILGYPSYSDPFMPAMANGVESIAFGDISRYFVRIVNGVRFERSDEFAFQTDLVSFRCIIRLDGALIDTGSLKTFVNTT